MFQIRQTQEDDYPELCNWWSKFRFPAPPLEALPENGKCGLMVYKGDINICAGFIYFTNSKIAWQEWIVSNFDYKEPDRKEAIQFLITELANIAKSRGFTILFTSVKNKHLVKHFESCGFSNNGSGTVEMTLML